MNDGGITLPLTLMAIYGFVIIYGLLVKRDSYPRTSSFYQILIMQKEFLGHFVRPITKRPVGTETCAGTVFSAMRRARGCGSCKVRADFLSGMVGKDQARGRPQHGPSSKL